MVEAQGPRTFDRGGASELGRLFVRGTPSHERLHGGQAPRGALDTAARDAHGLDIATVEPHRGCDVYQREVPRVAVRDLFEVEPRARGTPSGEWEIYGVDDACVGSHINHGVQQVETRCAHSCWTTVAERCRCEQRGVVRVDLI